MEVLLCSVEEPQLERCLKSIEEQIVPFTNIVHQANIVPYSKAHNEGLPKLKDDWCMMLAGDMILHSYAVELSSHIIENDVNNIKTGAYLFGVYDTFLKQLWGGIGIYRSSTMKMLPFRDKNNFIDIHWGRRFEALGGELNNCHEHTLGTHFDKPDEYQVFRRFYVVGLKYNGSKVSRIHAELGGLYNEIKYPLYLTAQKAMEFAAFKNGLYPGSHNIDFEKKMYEEFNALQETCTS